MRPDISSDHVTVGTLAELDALIGERILGVTPTIYWEDSYANQRFDSLEEALDAMRDPFFQLFIPEHERSAAVLSEIREYPAYSSKMQTALEVVEHFSAGGNPLLLRQKNYFWFASFGGHPECRSRNAASAICLAALRARGLTVDLREGPGAMPRR